MELTQRRWKILFFLCISLILAGMMIYLGQNPMVAIQAGIEGAVNPAAGMTGPKPNIPNRPVPPVVAPVGPLIPAPVPPAPAIIPLAPTSESTLRDAATAAIPVDATTPEVVSVEYAFRHVAEMIPLPNTPDLVVQATKNSLADTLPEGPSRDRWSIFSSKIATALEMYQREHKLDNAGAFVAPWTAIADGVAKGRK